MRIREIRELKKRIMWNKRTMRKQEKLIRINLGVWWT